MSRLLRGLPYTRVLRNTYSPQANGLVFWLPNGTALNYEQTYGAVGTFTGIHNLISTERGLAQKYEANYQTCWRYPYNSRFSGLSVITVSHWVYWLNFSDHYRYTVAQSGFGETPDRCWRFRTEQAANLVWQISNDGNDPGAAEATYPLASLSHNRWYHIVGTLDASGYLHLYIDGKLVSSALAETPPIYDLNTIGVSIGSSWDDSVYARHDGYIDDVRVYNRALSDAEVWQLYDPATRWDLYDIGPPLVVGYIEATGALTVADIQHSHNLDNVVLTQVHNLTVADIQHSHSLDNVVLGLAGVTLTQEGFRWRNDDGSESAATWAATQDANHSISAEAAIRLRILIDAANDPDAGQYRLEYRKVGDPDWKVVQ
jgi:hypothetical protein